MMLEIELSITTTTTVRISPQEMEEYAEFCGWKDFRKRQAHETDGEYMWDMKDYILANPHLLVEWEEFGPCSEDLGGDTHKVIIHDVEIKYG